MIQIRKVISKEDIYSVIDSYDIFTRFCTNFVSIGSSFRSELRKDSSPSASISMRGGELLYMDFGDSSQTKPYNAIGYVMRKYDINYNEALIMIASSFKITSSNGTHRPKIITSNKPKIEYLPTIIDVRQRAWHKWDEIYYGQFKIPLSKVKEKPIVPISHYWLTNHKVNNLCCPIPPRHLGYSYNFGLMDDVFRRKIYRPFSKNKKSKWVSNTPKNIIQNIQSLPKEGGKRLFITSSYKDCLIFELIGEYAIAPIGENIFIPDDIMLDLLSKWDEVIIWFDNDWSKKENNGVIFAEKYATQYNIPFFYNPDGEPKDPSDFTKKYDLIKFKSIVYGKIRSI